MWWAMGTSAPPGDAYAKVGENWRGTLSLVATHKRFNHKLHSRNSLCRNIRCFISGIGLLDGNVSPLKHKMRFLVQTIVCELTLELILELKF